MSIAESRINLAGKELGMEPDPKQQCEGCGEIVDGSQIDWDSGVTICLNCSHETYTKETEDELQRYYNGDRGL